MDNPFDDPNAHFFVLTNSLNQHSLWPKTLPRPEGWTTAFGPAPRQDCLDFTDREWHEMNAQDPA
ncbi:MULTISPECIES: MbtH family protein [unclassified Pseudomonas]|jgi:MbtH protein|uniref:MbtH family protein n=1 Tax=unclassified Pseudomonas TaxID=196821 RepID=UPI00096B6D47|nr:MULTISPECIES: MbtH family protein [unclassified Pseudomonas]MDY0832060.1 MbtH family protein [Pseudomonas sp. SED1]NIL19207.1 MbtH family protein [Pseudomonas sp. AN3A02]OLY75353.1 hypothetical protein AU074_24175 [Pseudomonas sp. ATCC PTA-122608]